MSAAARATVSVVIPTYNRAHVVGEAVKSALDQSAPAEEIIVVDDGSTDGTKEALASFGEQIVVLKQANQGAAAARNTGAARAVGDWIAFLDSDDLWIPDRLAALLRDAASNDMEPVAHVGNVRFVGPGYDQDYFSLRRFDYPQGAAVRVDRPIDFPISSFFLQAAAVRRHAFLAAGGFDASLRVHEDADLFCRLALAGPWLITGDVLAQVRRNEMDAIALSNDRLDRPATYRRDRVAMLEKLSNAPLLSDERIFVQRNLSGALYELAEAEFPNAPVRARRTLLRAAWTHPDHLRGFMKIAPPLLAGRFGFRLRPKRGREFRR